MVVHSWTSLQWVVRPEEDLGVAVEAHQEVVGDVVVLGVVVAVDEEVTTGELLKCQLYTIISKQLQTRSKKRTSR